MSAIHRFASLAVSTCLCPLWFWAPLPGQIGGTGQDGVFQPKTDTTLDTSSKASGFDFKSIDIPVGVTVTLIGSNPAILRSQGAVTIAGHLSADSRPGSDATKGGIGGPGGFDGGDGGRGSGKWGSGPGGGVGGIAPFGQPGSGEPGGHATSGSGRSKTYGDFLPFDLRGGSGSGGGAYPVSWQQTGPGGSGGGGTIVLLADGVVTVQKTGSVTAISLGFGAGGSIMIRSMRNLSVAGKIDAAGRRGIFSFPTAGDGFVRLDRYGRQPVIADRTNVTPAPATLAIPAIREAAVLRIGANYVLRAAAPPGDGIAFFVSTKAVSIPLPSLGELGLDPTAYFFLGAATAASTGVDPQAELSVSVPNDTRLRGLRVYVQALNSPTKAAIGPRLSNVLSAVVQ